MAGIYLHIPFCQSKCLYCDFYSVVNARQMEGFAKAIQIEATKRSYELGGEEISTVYFGGGTPSLLNHKFIGEILSTLRSEYTILPTAEITMECNPGDVSQIDVAKLVSYGVNRFSIGAQSFQPQLLKTLGRRHSAEETKELFGYLRSEGIENISLDLIYSIPGESIDMLRRDLAYILSLSPEHISAYDLIYEQGTPFFEMRAKGALTEVSEELSLEMSHTVRDFLALGGYEQYEISNYAKPGRHSKHNTSYWQGIPYIGLGPSAHSYKHPWRSWNISSIDEYNKGLLTGAGFLDREYERITPEMEYEEYFLTRLRTKEGISLSEIEAKGFTIPYATLSQMEDEGLIERQRDRYHLSTRGIDYADRVILNLVNN